jgi:hypothetical protein
MFSRRAHRENTNPLTDPDYCEPDAPQDERSKPYMAVGELGPLKNRWNPKCGGDRDDEQNPTI